MHADLASVTGAKKRFFFLGPLAIVNAADGKATTKKIARLETDVAGRRRRPGDPLPRPEASQGAARAPIREGYMRKRTKQKTNERHNY